MTDLASRPTTPQQVVDISNDRVASKDISHPACKADPIVQLRVPSIACNQEADVREAEDLSLPLRIPVS